MTFVSVIIPAYNEEATLAKTLQSLLNQTYKNYEIIVIDNNSTDKTGLIAQQYIKQVYLEKKRGYHNAVKHGVSVAKGTIITVCDADTLYPNSWLDQAVKAFEKDKRIVAVYGPAWYRDGSLFIRTIGVAIFWFVCFISRFFGIPITSGFNFLMKKSAYLAVGGYDPNIFNMVGMDIELGQRLKTQGILFYTPFNLPKTSTRRLKKTSVFNFIITSLNAWWRFYLKKSQQMTYDDYNITSR